MYEFFCVFLVLGPGLVLILVLAGRWFEAAVVDNDLSVIVVVLALLVVLDGAVVAVAGIKVDFRAAVSSGATTISLVGISGVIFVVVPVPIAWNATNAFYGLAGIFFCLVVILILVERQFEATVLNVDTKVIVSGVICVGVGVVGLFPIAWNATRTIVVVVSLYCLVLLSVIGAALVVTCVVALLALA